MEALISDIKRFAVHDGDGIRTTVFFKGCPLKCVWCHNPESISYDTQPGFFADKCIGCMECVGICDANEESGGKHIFSREKCSVCGKCEDVCLGEAFKLYGKKMSVDEVLSLVMEDKSFYDNSGGGVTLSGGECLSQWQFCAELLKELKQNGVNTAVDTCGFVSREALCAVLPYTDIFLYDIKAIDSSVHMRCTGQKNDIILDNLTYLAECGKPVEIRVPYIPSYNAGEMEKIAQFSEGLGNITKVKLLKYHKYAASRYAALGMANTLPEAMPPTDADMAAAAAHFAARGIKVTF